MIGQLFVAGLRRAQAIARGLFLALRSADKWLGARLTGVGEIFYAIFSWGLYVLRHPGIVRERGALWPQKLSRHFRESWQRTGSALARFFVRLVRDAGKLRSAIGNMFLSTFRLLSLGARVALHLGASLTWKRTELKRVLRSRRLHTNGCGDFTLLSREDWFRLRGYPEWPIFSWHLDSVLMFAANANDISEVALGPAYRVYHIDHSSGWSPEGGDQLFERLTTKGIPYLTNEDTSRLRERYNRDPDSAVVNDDDWGLANLDLPDRTVYPAGAAPERSEPVTDRRPRVRGAGFEALAVKAVP